MTEVTEVAAGATGAVLLVLVCLSVLRTVFAPGQRSSRAARWTARLAARVVALTVRGLPPNTAGRLLDLCAPLGLCALAAVWLLGVCGGCALLAVATGTPVRALVERPGAAGTAAVLLVVFVAVAFTTMLVRIGDAYDRRERALVQLVAEVPLPADIDTVLAMCIGSTSRARIDHRFEEWASWFADVQYTHLSYPVLLYSRPAGDTSWTRAAVIALDSAALVVSMAPGWAPHQTRVLLTCGVNCLTKLCAAAGLTTPATGPSHQGREENTFGDAVRYATDAGLKPERDHDQMWSAFQDLRAGYAPRSTAICHALGYDIDRPAYP
ncbi:hypothetical protein [Umezawaea tangerina]|uniref:Uncharacterized protein n=1 Tax=Umezawaea tangerina TaxID=84725 RepID=A0A2T0T6G0_9PSEU|nr:hypothetical protein [Umezawaea tangerina]PRY41246.1 hypothetical protein CLV43_1054 [Umezawaea tangerina]